MYQILNLNTGEIWETDSPRYVRIDERGVWIEANKVDAQALALFGKLFSLIGKQSIEGTQCVAVSEVDVAEKLKALKKADQTNAADVAEVQAAIIDVMDALIDIYENGI